METDTADCDTLSRRIAYLRKAYAKGLGHKPTTLESAAIMRAARLTAEAERVLADPTASINDKVRIDGAAHRARLAMETALAPSKRDQGAPTLGSLLRGESARA